MSIEKLPSGKYRAVVRHAGGASEHKAQKVHRLLSAAFNRAVRWGAHGAGVRPSPVVLQRGAVRGCIVVRTHRAIAARASYGERMSGTHDLLARDGGGSCPR